MSSVRRLVAPFLVLFMVMAGSLAAFSPSPSAAQNVSTPGATPTTDYPAVDVVQRVGPAVVTVINEQTVQGIGPNSTSQLQPVGSGTGFIIDKQGHIVTNWHVVNGGQSFQVIFANNETRSAKLVGSDQFSDLAVVQVSGDIPATISFGDSSQLQPGQPVLAIGSPLGAFSNTVTEGIVSATGRSLPQSASQGPQIYTNLIQHDAPINPGNSGGPLLNLNGEVVGVNTLGIPSEQGQPVQGLFFAIPSNTVKQITAQIIANGYVAYPFVGVTAQPVTQDVAARAKLSVDYGVYIIDVTSKGPADQASIQKGDVILAIDGQRIDETHSFEQVLFMHRPGDTVEMTVLRDGKQMTVKVKLGERQSGS